MPSITQTAAEIFNLAPQYPKNTSEPIIGEGVVGGRNVFVFSYWPDGSIRRYSYKSDFGMRGLDAIVYQAPEGSVPASSHTWIWIAGVGLLGLIGLSILSRY